MESAGLWLVSKEQMIIKCKMWSSIKTEGEKKLYSIDFGILSNVDVQTLEII